MSSSGPLYPSSATGENDGGGRVTWDNVTDIYTSNDARASTGYSAVGTQYIVAKNYGFSIPSGSTIDGILVTFERYGVYGSGHSRDENLNLTKDGSTSIGTNKADVGVNWNQFTESTFNYGSSSDLWGTTWTDSEINSSNFGVRFRATATGFARCLIDTISITVYYTEASGQPCVVRSRSIPFANGNNRFTRIG